MAGRKLLPGLTALRFAAAILVVIGHGGSTFTFLRIPLFDVRQAVSFFFVLSGFILAYTYADRELHRNYTEFFVARIAKLWPVHLLTASLTLIFLSSALWSAPFRENAQLIAANIFLLQSWSPSQTWYFSLNAVSWSISTEVAFYIYFPFILASILRYPTRWLVAIASCLGTALALAGWFQMPALEAEQSYSAWYFLYIFPPTRLCEFILGIISYRLIFLPHKKMAGGGTTQECIAFIFAVAAVLTTTALANWSIASPAISVWLRTCGGCLAFAFLIGTIAQEDGAISRFLALRPLVYFGEISFALYMVHQIVIRYMRENHMQFMQASPATACLAYFILSILAASTIYHLVEKPARSMIRGNIRVSSAGLWKK